MTTTSTTIGRLQVDHPDLGHDAGASLHTKIATIYQKLADNIGARYFEADALANGASVDLDHNFKDAFSNLRVHLFERNTGDGELTRIVSGGSPSLDDFAIVATPGSLTTQLRVTNNTGVAQDIAIIIFQGSFAEKLDDLSDVDLATTAPLSGDFLRYNGSQFVPIATSTAGTPPIGAIVAYNPGYYTDSSNGTFTLAGGSAGNDVASVNTFLNSSGWYVCDGAAVNEVSSPIFNAAGRHVPNLTDDRFIQGSTAAGAIGGSSSSSHTHTFAHTHGTNSQLGTITLSHSHTVNAHTHSTPNHSHSVNSHTHSMAHVHQFAFRDSGGRLDSHTGANVNNAAYSDGISAMLDYPAVQSGGGTNASRTSGAANVRYFTTGALNNSQSLNNNTGSSSTSTNSSGGSTSGSSSPGTNSQLSNYNASHSHSTNSQSTSTTSVPSVTENRPKYLANFYIIRVV